MVARVAEDYDSNDSMSVAPHAMAAQAGQGENQHEKMCWNCRGIGHVKVDANGKVICPSPVKPRSISSAIALLEMYRRREAGRGGKRKMFARRAIHPAKSATVANPDDLVEVLVDDDGSVYTTEGVFMGSAVEMAGQLTTEGPAQQYSSHQGTSSAEGNMVSATESTQVGDNSIYESRCDASRRRQSSPRDR